MTLDRYLAVRRRFETGFWLILFLVSFTSEATITWLEANRQASQTALREIITWEASSNLMLLCLVPVVLLFDRYCPLGWKQPRRHILALIYLYRHILFRLQGEASLLDAPDEGIGDEDGKKERLLVKKLGREFLIRVADIEHIAASGNYVNLHIGGRIYPLRDTMAGIEKQLDTTVFRRIHRSHIVSINHVREIEPLDSGDARVLLTNGEAVPMSRTYKGAIS